MLTESVISRPIRQVICLPTSFKGWYLLWLERQLVGSCGRYLYCWHYCCLVAVAKANISTEKVGSTIISRFQEVMLLNASIGRRRRWERSAVLPLLMIVLPVLPTLAHVLEANARFHKHFRGCCVAGDLSRPETPATVFVCSFMCSPTLVWIARALLRLVLVFFLHWSVLGCSGC